MNKDSKALNAKEAWPSPFHAKEVWLPALLALTRVFSEPGEIDRILERAFKVLEKESSLGQVHLYMAGKGAEGLHLKASSRSASPAELVPDQGGLAPCHPIYGAYRAGESFKGYVGRMGMVVAVPVHIGGKTAGMMVAEPSENTPESLEATHGFLAIVAHFISQAITIHEAATQDKEELVAENYLLLEETSRGYRAENIIYASGAMQEVVDRAMTVAKSNADALILGETGTGKELIAGLVHYHSARSGKPLVRVNCAALPAGLLESELFGHVKGAFTGAVSARQGRFEMADGGSILLDEVAEIPLDLQPKLLRVLQEREYDPVGASVTKRVNVRVIAASNRDLDKEVAEGRFRQDLYYRLNVVPIIIPPLRRRTGDIPPLVEFFIARSNRKNFKDVHGVTQKAMDLFLRYSWPGNVRELENAVEHAVVLSDKPEIETEHLPLALRVFAGGAEKARLPAEAPVSGSESGIAELAAKALSTPGQAYQMYLDEAESVLFKKALDVAGGNRTEAARMLGLSRNTLAKRLTELGLAQ